MARSRRGSRRWLRKAWRLMPRSLVARVLIVLGVPALAFVASVNLAVGFFGNVPLNPLSPFHLDTKLVALGRYFRHRPVCLVTGGHDELGPVVAEIARRRNVDRWLLAALVHVESGSQPHRISHAGAMGAAQLIPSTADMLGVRDAYDPREGIDGGARYLRRMLDRYRGNTRLAVAAYNAGPGAVRDRVPVNGETEFYVDRVLARWRDLRPRRLAQPDWKSVHRLVRASAPPKPPPPRPAPPPEKAPAKKKTKRGATPPKPAPPQPAAPK